MDENNIYPSGEFRDRILEAFRFFDYNDVGYLRTEELGTIIHCLGFRYSHHKVMSLINRFADPESHKLYYRKIFYN